MKKIFNGGNQIHNFMSSYGSGYGFGSISQKVTVLRFRFRFHNTGFRPGKNTYLTFGHYNDYLHIRILDTIRVRPLDLSTIHVTVPTLNSHPNNHEYTPRQDDQHLYREKKESVQSCTVRRKTFA